MSALKALCLVLLNAQFILAFHGWRKRSVLGLLPSFLVLFGYWLGLNLIRDLIHHFQLGVNFYCLSHHPTQLLPVFWIIFTSLNHQFSYDLHFSPNSLILIFLRLTRNLPLLHFHLLQVPSKFSFPFLIIFPTHFPPRWTHVQIQTLINLF